jgi:hypothetical protein
MSSESEDDYEIKRSKFPPRTDVDLREMAKQFHEQSQPVLLWVDPNRSRDNAQLQSMIDTVPSPGIRVVRVSDTDEAMAQMLGPLSAVSRLPPSKFRVLTNKTRKGPDGQVDPQAGQKMAASLRELGFSGPILMFCGDLPGAIRTLTESSRLFVTDDIVTALSFATFQPIYETFDCKSITSMFPDFARLLREDISSRQVMSADLKTAIEAHNKRCALPQASSDTIIADLVSQEVAFTKYYIPRSVRWLKNDTHAAHLFHAMEDITMQFVDVRNPLCPRVERVIAIDNPKLKQRFLAAAQVAEGAGPRPWSSEVTDAPYLNLLRMSIPESKDFPNCRPALLFHCTTDARESMICSVGFRPEYLGLATGNQGWYGRGLYFSTMPTYTHWYQPSRTAHGRVGELCFIVSWVLVGNACPIKKKEIGCSQKPGSLTHYAIVHRTTPIEASWNVGKLPDGDEVVVFDPAHVLPQFVVEMTKPAASAAPAAAAAAAS